MAFEKELEKHLNKQLLRFTQGNHDQAGDVMERLDHLCNGDLNNAGIRPPNARAQVTRLGELIYRSRYEDSEVKLVSPVCPDYATRTDPITRKKVYDFGKLEDGIGLTAEAVLEKAPTFLERVREAGINISSHQILLADVEAYDPVILESVNLTQEQFLANLSQSRIKLALAAEAVSGEIEVGIMSDFIKPQDQQRARALIETVKPSSIRGFALNRSDLYLRWFGGRSGVDIDELVVSRAKEDIAKALEFGSAIRREGVIVLDPTSDQLASYYNYSDGLIAPIFMINNRY